MVGKPDDITFVDCVKRMALVIRGFAGPSDLSMNIKTFF